MLVALIRPIIANKPKVGWCDESLGIYRLCLESTPEPMNRIESQLFFWSKAEHMPKLIAQTKQILALLMETISQEDIE